MVNKTIFNTLTLSDNVNVSIIEIKAYHYFKAISLCNGNTNILYKYLILCIVEIDNKLIEESYLNNMPFSDLSLIIESISAMIGDSYKNLL